MMTTNSNMIVRTKLKPGLYQLINSHGSSTNNAETINIEEVLNINVKRVHSTYRAKVDTNNELGKIAYIKLCDNLEFAISLSDQYKSFSEVLVGIKGFKTPTVIGVIKSPPCVVTEIVPGRTLDIVLSQKLAEESINTIASRVGQFIALYHTKWQSLEDLNRLVAEIRKFTIKSNLRNDRIDEVLENANLSAVRVHQDPKPANFIWDSTVKTLGIIDPTHKPYIRFPHYDLAVVQHFPLYSKSYYFQKNLKLYRRKVIRSYCKSRRFDWCIEDEVLTVICLLQNLDKYKKQSISTKFIKKIFIRVLISVKRHLLIEKYRLR